jgi:hypothetical protein
MSLKRGTTTGLKIDLAKYRSSRQRKEEFSV